MRLFHPGPPERPHHHHPLHHRRHRHGHSESLMQLILNLANQGLIDEELHNVIDRELQKHLQNGNAAIIRQTDPGRVAAERPINPLMRAAALEAEIRRVSDQAAYDLSKQHVLVAGEFPPYILDYLLDTPGARMTQLHPPGPHGHLPPHFRHLAHRGLVGITSIHKLAVIQADAVLFEGYPKDGDLLVSPFVPLALRMFNGVKALVLESDHCAPHMEETIEDAGFERLAGIFD